MGDAPVVWFLPEQITFLYYSAIYETLTPGQRLVYNRLHASYFCEMCAFLEEELPRYYLKAASAPRVPARLLVEARALADSERWHATMFRSVARSFSPALYSECKYVFIRTPPAGRMIRALLSAPALRPMLLWIALIQEERGVFFAEEILRQREQVDPRMVDWQRRHLADEVNHVSLGEALLPLYWDASRPSVRRWNGRLVRFVLREFLSAPKRAGIRVIDHWVKECPELKPRKAELMRAMQELDRDPRFHESLYSRKIVPKTFALFDRYTEFRDLGKGLWGYSPEVTP